MSLLDRFDALDAYLKAKAAKYALPLFKFNLLMFVASCGLFGFFSVLAPGAAPLFASSAVMFAIGAVANGLLAIQPKEQSKK